MRLTARAQRSDRILLLFCSRSQGGMRRTVADLADELDRRGRDVVVGVPVGDRDVSAVEWWQRQRASVRIGSPVLDVVHARSAAAMLVTLRLIRAVRPHTLSLHYPGSWIPLRGVLAARMARPKCCVATIHGSTPLDRYLSRREIACTRTAARLCYKVVARSAAARSVLLDAGVSASRVLVARGGVSPPAHPPRKAEARASLGLPADAFVVASVGRLVPGKGMADVVEAAARLPDSRGGAHLVIAGDGPKRAALVEQAAARLQGRAWLPGAVQEPDLIYAAADVFVLASYDESFGRVFVEAAFHGVPSVGTHVGGVPEAVLDGVTGLLVPPRDPEALAAALQCFRDDPDLRRRMGEAARERAHAEFTVGALTDVYEQASRGR